MTARPHPGRRGPREPAPAGRDARSPRRATRSTPPATARPASSSLAGATYDLVLTDLKLPDRRHRGSTCCAPRKRAQPSTPVVVFTAFGSVGTAVEAMKLGAADFLEKPIEIEDLLKLVDTWVRQEGDVPAFVLSDGTRIVGASSRG